MGVGSLVAALHRGVVTTGGLGLGEGSVLADRELDVTVARLSLRKGQSSGSEENGGSEELHFDG